METDPQRGEFEGLLPKRHIGATIAITALVLYLVMLLAGIARTPFLLVSIGSLYGIGGALSTINKRVQRYLRINNGVFPAMYAYPNSEGEYKSDEELEKALPDAWGFSVWFGIAAFFYTAWRFNFGNYMLFVAGIALGCAAAEFFVWYRIRHFKKKYNIAA
jgi:hypothetical protein